MKGRRPPSHLSRLGGVTYPAVCHQPSPPCVGHAPGAARGHAQNSGAGTRRGHARVGAGLPARCSPPCENHLPVGRMVGGRESGLCPSPATRHTPFPWHLHMLSWRTKLAMLLCLKYWGSTSLAKRLWSLTRKLVPLYRAVPPRPPYGLERRPAERCPPPPGLTHCSHLFTRLSMEPGQNQP